MKLLQYQISLNFEVQMKRRLIEIIFILIIQGLVEYNMPFANNIVIRRVSDFIYNIEFVVSDEICVNRTMADFAIGILFATFLKDVNMDSTTENMKMR